MYQNLYFINLVHWLPKAMVKGLLNTVPLIFLSGTIFYTTPFWSLRLVLDRENLYRQEADIDFILIEFEEHRWIQR